MSPVWDPAILHVDMDAFFASVEVLDDPTLAGKPVVVGGSGPRGVVASCTYEARAFGVRSAMASMRARQLCPQAVFVDGHFSRYTAVSAALRRILLSTTPLVEPVGLDEAFLDVTGAQRLLGDPEQMARTVRERVHRELHLDCSVGIGRSKMIAKLASRAAKPVAIRAGKQPGRGVVAVAPEAEQEFLRPMAVESLWGVGPATARRLHDLGVRTVADLAALPGPVLTRKLGRAQGVHLVALARAEDRDPVVPDRPAKSVGHEETFRHDLTDRADLGRHLDRMAESVAVHLRGQGLAGRTVTVKVKRPDFSVVTRGHTLPSAVEDGRAMASVAGALLDTIEVTGGVRLLGLSVSGLQPSAAGRQLTFDLTAAGSPAEQLQATWAEVTAAVDAVRARFGREAVGTASMVGPDGVEVPARREAPWGPGPEPRPGPAAGSYPVLGSDVAEDW
ncbi:MAG: DNA polymerase IV [Acidimicrobiales bacterium]